MLTMSVHRAEQFLLWAKSSAWKITADHKFRFPQFQTMQCFMCCAWCKLLAVVLCAGLHMLLLLLSSSSSPLCRVLILIFLRQTMSLGNTVLQLFCCFCLWCLYHYLQCWIHCTFILVLFEVCAQCPIWLFSIVPWLHVFLVCCSRIF